MTATLLPLLGVLFQVAGFVILCRLGGRLSDKLQERSQWAALAVGGVVIVITVAVVCSVGRPLPFWAQTAGFFGAALGGGIVVRQRNRIVGE